MPRADEVSRLMAIIVLQLYEALMLTSSYARLARLFRSQY
jgi:hypothetical protein